MATQGSQERMELVSMTATPPGMPRTGAAGGPVSPWALLVALLGMLSVLGGLAFRRRRAATVAS
jgi:hypothetical protein